MGVTRRAAHKRFVGKKGDPARTAELPDLIPYNNEAKKTLELTFREALRLGHTQVGTEHILLALLENEAETGVPTAAGVSQGAVRGFIEHAASSGEPETASP